MLDQRAVVARAVVDTLRSGVVSRLSARHVSVGRDQEIAAISRSISACSGGSFQVVCGGYGVGKSHLCEVIREHLLSERYAVVLLELGATHCACESPRAIIEHVRHHIEVRIGRRTIRGENEISVLRYAACRPRWFGVDFRGRVLTRVYARVGGDEPRDVLTRYRYLRHFRELGRAHGYGDAFGDRILTPVPAPMTAANRAVWSLQDASRVLVTMGFKGLVVLVDEAERGEWAWTSYRVERSRQMLHWLAAGSLDLPTTRLHYYRNDADHEAERRYSPSHLHVALCFASEWGLACELARYAAIEPLRLGPLSEDTILEVLHLVGTLYQRAYSRLPRVSERHLRLIRLSARTGDVRHAIRQYVAALDHARWYCNDGS